MQAIPVARQYLFNQITSTLERMNVNVGRAMSLRGIPDWRYVDQASFIPIVHFINAFEAGAHATGDDRFSILVAADHDLDCFGVYGDAIKSAVNVLDAMTTACQLASSQASTLRFWLSRSDAGVLFCRKQSVTTPDLASALIQLERYTLALLVNIVRLGADPSWSPPWVCLSAPKDRTFTGWEEFAEARVEFDAPFSAMLVPTDVLSMPLRRKRQSDLPVNEAIETRLNTETTGPKFVHDLRQLTTALLRVKSANLAAIADATLLSQRTIQRRLAEQGLTFKDIVEQARYETATHFLERSDASVADVSEHTGYENPQHFIRAFKRWSGVTPSKYRRLAISRRPVSP